MATSTCTVCCEKLNKSNHKEVICVFCNFSVCRDCFQKYCNDLNEDPQCMNCKKIFDRMFMTNNCTIVFLNGVFKKHREEVLFNREKGLLPESQPYVELQNIKNGIQREIDNLNSEKYKLQMQISNLNNKITHCYGRMTGMTIANMHTHISPASGAGSSSSSSEDRRKFIRKCPITDCRGFLSSRWKCGSCEKQICKDCNEEVLENHECLPDNVASMTLLNKDTKGCPQCGTMIYRIAGCSHMFCTDCHCSWDWNTQALLQGKNTNPHYYEFVRNNGNPIGRDINDIPCGGLPDVYQLRTIFNRTKNHIDDSVIVNLYSLHNCITHIERIEISRVIPTDLVAVNRPLRVQYLMNTLSEDLFKTQLQMREKVREKTIDFNNIYQMFVTVGSDIFSQIYIELRNATFYKNSPTSTTLMNHYTILIQLTVYFNENIKKIGKMYKCVYPGFTRDYKWTGNLENYLKKLKV